MYPTYHLSHDDAMRIVRAVEQELIARGKSAAVAVSDANGELIAFLRLDNCKLPPIYNAINKAYAAAREQKETGALGQASREEGFPLTNYGELRYPGWAGGVPIFYQGQIVGGVGVSGMAQEEDEEIARIGIQAVEGLSMQA